MKLNHLFNMYNNDDITLSLHKECFGGAAQDFVMRFKKQETSIEDIIAISSTVVKRVIDTYQRKRTVVFGRLVARVVYTTLSDNEPVVYYHPSYRSERIHDAKDFYTRHMMKIVQRMDNFNRNGSNLIIKNIDEIHLHFSTLD